MRCERPCEGTPWMKIYCINLFNYNVDKGDLGKQVTQGVGGDFDSTYWFSFSHSLLNKIPFSCSHIAVIWKALVLILSKCLTKHHMILSKEWVDIVVRSSLNLSPSSTLMIWWPKRPHRSIMYTVCQFVFASKESQLFLAVCEPFLLFVKNVTLHKHTCMHVHACGNQSTCMLEINIPTVLWGLRTTPTHTWDQKDYA